MLLRVSPFPFDFKGMFLYNTLMAVDSESFIFFLLGLIGFVVGGGDKKLVGPVFYRENG